MKQFFQGALVAVVLLSNSVAFAQVPSASAAVSAYRSFRDVGTPTNVKVPTVLEVPFDNDFLERYEFAVLDQTSGVYQPSYFKQTWRTKQAPVTASSIPASLNPAAMLDEDTKTYTQFDLPAQGIGSTQIQISASKMVTSSGLTLLVDDFVALPNYIQISAVVNGVETIVLARQQLGYNTVRFPRTTSAQWKISLSYGQPLRITELRLLQEGAEQERTRSLRFLAQPGHNYRIYFDPDRTAYIPTGESGNLTSDKDVLRLPLDVTVVPNPTYTQADKDGDGVIDARDNCVAAANSDQLDVDANGRGDVCDDFDRDGVTNPFDNCRDMPNAGQADIDADGLGDACDGQESRITERYSWIPWVGMGFAGIVLVGLFASMARSMKKGVPPPTTPPQV